MNRKVVITNCFGCIFSKEENHVRKGNDYGTVLKCKVQDDKELCFDDNDYVVHRLYKEVHESCKLDLDN